jgi:hypothetical protein
MPARAVERDAKWGVVKVIRLRKHGARARKCYPKTAAALVSHGAAEGP